MSGLITVWLFMTAAACAIGLVAGWDAAKAAIARRRDVAWARRQAWFIDGVDPVPYRPTQRGAR